MKTIRPPLFLRLPPSNWFQPKCGIGKNETVGFLVPNEGRGGGATFLITIVAPGPFRGHFLEHPKQVLIEVYIEVDGGEPSYLTIGGYR